MYHPVVLNDPKLWSLPASEFKLYVALLTFANPDGTNAYPSNKTLAAMLGKDERTVRRLMGNLEDAGLLSRKFRPIGKFGMTARDIVLHYVAVIGRGEVVIHDTVGEDEQDEETTVARMDLARQNRRGIYVPEGDNSVMGEDISVLGEDKIVQNMGDNFVQGEEDKNVLQPYPLRQPIPLYEEALLKKVGQSCVRASAGACEETDRPTDRPISDIRPEPEPKAIEQKPVAIQSTKDESIESTLASDGRTRNEIRGSDDVLDPFAPIPSRVANEAFGVLAQKPNVPENLRTLTTQLGDVVGRWVVAMVESGETASDDWRLGEVLRTVYAKGMNVSSPRLLASMFGELPVKRPVGVSKYGQSASSKEEGQARWEALKAKLGANLSVRV